MIRKGEVMADFAILIARKGYEVTFAENLTKNALVSGSVETEQAALVLGLELIKQNTDTDLELIEDTLDTYPVEIWVGETTPVVVGWEVEGYGFPREFYEECYGD